MKKIFLLLAIFIATACATQKTGRIVFDPNAKYVSPDKIIVVDKSKYDDVKIFEGPFSITEYEALVKEIGFDCDWAVSGNKKIITYTVNCK